MPTLAAREGHLGRAARRQPTPSSPTPASRRSSGRASAASSCASTSRQNGKAFRLKPPQFRQSGLTRRGESRGSCGSITIRAWRAGAHLGLRSSWGTYMALLDPSVEPGGRDVAASARPAERSVGRRPRPVRLAGVGRAPPLRAR